MSACFIANLLVAIWFKPGKGEGPSRFFRARSVSDTQDQIQEIERAASPIGDHKRRRSDLAFTVRDDFLTRLDCRARVGKRDRHARRRHGFLREATAMVVATGGRRRWNSQYRTNRKSRTAGMRLGSRLMMMVATRLFGRRRSLRSASQPQKHDHRGYQLPSHCTYMQFYGVQLARL